MLTTIMFTDASLGVCVAAINVWVTDQLSTRVGLSLDSFARTRRPIHAADEPPLDCRWFATDSLSAAVLRLLLALCRIVVRLLAALMPARAVARA